MATCGREVYQGGCGSQLHPILVKAMISPAQSYKGCIGPIERRRDVLLYLYKSTGSRVADARDCNTVGVWL